MKLTAAIALVAVFSACGKKDDAGSAATTQKTQHVCSLEVAKKVSGSFAGSATGDDQAKVEEDAWADACSKLPEPDRASCRDSTRFQATLGGGSSESGGKKTFNTTVTLAPVAKGFAGSGQSETSADDACKQAIAQACKAAGASGDCTAGGEYDKQNVMQSSETMTTSK